MAVTTPGESIAGSDETFRRTGSETRAPLTAAQKKTRFMKWGGATAAIIAAGGVYVATNSGDGDSNPSITPTAATFGDAPIEGVSPEPGAPVVIETAPGTAAVEVVEVQLAANGDVITVPRTYEHVSAEDQRILERLADPNEAGDYFPTEGTDVDFSIFESPDTISQNELEATTEQILDNILAAYNTRNPAIGTALSDGAPEMSDYLQNGLAADAVDRTQVGVISRHTSFLSVVLTTSGDDFLITVSSGIKVFQRDESIVYDSDVATRGRQGTSLDTIIRIPINDPDHVSSFTVDVGAN